jgi:hypothetical protein
MLAVFREGNSDVVDQIKRRINESKTALHAVAAGVTVHVGLGAGAGGYETPYDLRFEVADRTYGVTKTNLVYVVRARLPYFNRQYPWYKEPALKLPVAAETAEKFISRVGHAIVTDLAPKIQAIEAEKAEKEHLARIKWENGDD